jgi:hypothetical protein
VFFSEDFYGENLMRFIQNSLRIAGSLKVTIVCLIFFFILVFSGTFYQVDNGLLAAQKKFFASWGLLLFKVIPFPGIKTISMVLSINLLLNGLKTCTFTIKKSGVLLMHFGMIVLFAGSAIASLYMKESVLTIFEGERASFSRDFSKWELIVIKKQFSSTGHRGVVSDTVSFHNIKNGSIIKFPNTALTLTVNRVYQNCNGLRLHSGQIDSLQQKKVSGDQAGNFPGIKGNVKSGSTVENAESRLLLYGGTIDPAILLIGEDTLLFMLKPHEIQLPFNIVLNRFVNINHPGTSDAKSFESYISVQGDGFSRDAVISMNRPFRYKSLTFYQNGFMQQNNFNATTLFVVDNSFRMIPYVSGFIIIAGLLINFIGKFSASLVSRKNIDSKS